MTIDGSPGRLGPQRIVEIRAVSQGSRIDAVDCDLEGRPAIVVARDDRRIGAGEFVNLDPNDRRRNRRSVSSKVSPDFTGMANLTVRLANKETVQFPVRIGIGSAIALGPSSQIAAPLTRPLSRGLSG